MPTTNSILRYPGGKTAYASLLKEVIHLNALKGYAMAECFAGGAGASLKLLLDKEVPSIILNDYDPAIYSVWLATLRHSQQLIDWIEQTPITIESWKVQKKIYTMSTRPSFELGTATLFLNRCNRSGIILANPIGGIRQEGKYKLDARFNKINLIRKIQTIAAVADQIELYNLDAIEFISHLNSSRRSVFIYFDPPYYNKGESLYMNHYDHKGHKALGSAIKKCKHPWLLSYDDSPAIAEIYKTYPIYKKELLYTIMPPSKGKEFIITQLDLPGQICLV
jgi:DNA adenine methylase